MSQFMAMTDKKPPQSAEELLQRYADGDLNFQDAHLFRANLAGAKLVEADFAGASLERAKFIEANLAGAKFIEANLERANLERANLVGAVVERANLAAVNLERANLAGAKLALVNLAGANLAGANLVGANLAGTNLVEANLERANLERANLVGAVAERADFAGADLALANLVGANLAGARLIEADVERANLERAKLVGANLVGANLDGANLEGANLEGAVVERAKLVGANLVGVSLVKANLEDAVLWNALLCGADFTGAILRNAGLDYACLRGDSLESYGLARTLFDAKELTQTQLDNAIGNEYTALPDGFLRPVSWKRGKGPEGADENYDRSLLVLQFKRDTELTTVQALAREMAAWTEHFAILASVTRSDSTAPIAKIYGGSLNLEVILSDPQMMAAIATMWLAVVGTLKSFQAMKKSPSHDDLLGKLNDTIRKCIDKFFMETPQRDEYVRKIEKLVRVAIYLAYFQKNGGRIILKASKPMLASNPILRIVMDEITTEIDHLN